jgi:hypothetical protein
MLQLDERGKNMKRTIKIALCLISIFLLFSIGIAHATSWTLTNIGASGGDGYVVVPSTIDPSASFDLYGSSSYWYAGIHTLYHTKLTEPATYTISWSYSHSNDTWGPIWDPAGYYVNGIYTQLTNASDYTQSGTLPLTLNAGDDVGFYVETYDNWYGRGILTIAGIPVPEPATMLLLGLGLVGIAGIRKKIKK